MQKNAGDFVCFVNELTVVKQNLQIDFCRVLRQKLLAVRISTVVITSKNVTVTTSTHNLPLSSLIPSFTVSELTQQDWRGKKTVNLV